MMVIFAVLAASSLSLSDCVSLNRDKTGTSTGECRQRDAQPSQVQEVAKALLRETEKGGFEPPVEV